MSRKLKEFSIPIAIIIGALIVGGVLIFLNQQKGEETAPETALSSQEVGEKAVDFINENLLPEGTTAILIKTTEENGVYKIHLTIDEEEYDSFITKDGKLLFPQGFSLEVPQEEEPSTQAPTQEVPKQDMPDIKLFVMSYCPFGLQTQKMFLPVYDLLKEKVNMGIYFVNYIMHGKEEIDENLRQYCIQKEEKEKYSSYLGCFVKEDNFNDCLDVAQIDRTKLTACIANADQEYNISSQYEDQDTWLNGQFPKFDVHSELNEEYEVRGSPTVVINGQTVSVNPRSPENFKTIICQAFNSPPENCSQTLSNDAPSPGFGLGTGSSSGGACQ